MNFFILDLETTSLDSSTGEIIDIGCVNTVTGATFECKVLPLHIKEADPESLKINGYKPEDWEEAFLLPHALQLLSEFVDSGTDDTPAYMMAYNVSFDRSFLEKAYKDCNLPYPFHYHHLDLLTLAWFRLPECERFSLRETCSRLGIPPEPPIHRALAGAQCAYEVYKKLTNNL